jgi:hypothetical protein
LEIELLDADGHSLETASADASGGGIVGADLHVPVNAIATFRVKETLLDSSGRKVGSANTDVRICPPELARVGLGADGFLRVEGKPYFPIGLYSGAKYPEIAKAGFMVTHNYEITTGEAGDPINPNEMRAKELLDEAWANGMRMMIELPRKAIEEGQLIQTRRWIETFRHHPGLLCWGSEERIARGKAKVERIAALYHLVKVLDPDHPFILGDSRDISKNMEKDRRNFFPEADMDVGIWWWYPIPLHTNAPLMEPPSWLTTTTCKKPLWIAIQSYKQPWQHSRYPTPAEYRDMAYLSLINGVKGLFFYTGSGEHDYNHQPAGLLNQPEASHRDYVQTLVKELREISPVVMAPSAAPLAVSPAGAPVECAVRELDGKLYLLAANKSDQPQSVGFSGAVLKGRRAEVMFESHSAAISGDSLTDQFEPYGVHVYRIE